VLFVALAVVRLPEARTTPRRIARLFFSVVVLALAASLLLEGAGAFEIFAPMHDLGGAIMLFAILTLPFALILLGVVYVVAGIRWGIAKMSAREAS
jgi:hypothetical protein